MSAAPGTPSFHASGTHALADQLRSLRAWIDRRSLRERALLAGVCAALLYGASTALLMEPLQEARAALGAEHLQLQESIAELEGQGQEILRLHTLDPDASLRTRQQVLARQVAALDLQIRDHTVSLISPEQMATVLEAVLEAHPGVELLRLEHLGVSAVTDPAGGEGATGLFRHGFEIELTGGYLDTLAYLLELEGLEWKFFWDSFEYRALDPEGSVLIRAHTLSAKEGWVGA